MRLVSFSRGLPGCAKTAAGNQQCLPGLQRDTEPAVHFGVWQDLVNYFVMPFQDEFSSLFKRIFAYIHFLTFLSIFPPFPHTYSELAHFFDQQAGPPSSLGGAVEPVISSWSWQAAWRERGLWTPTKVVITNMLSFGDSPPARVLLMRQSSTQDFCCIHFTERKRATWGGGGWRCVERSGPKIQSPRNGLREPLGRLGKRMSKV